MSKSSSYDDVLHSAQLRLLRRNTEAQISVLGQQRQSENMASSIFPGTPMGPKRTRT